jgi:3-hydroxyisobutyrate dehydrogenase
MSTAQLNDRQVGIIGVGLMGHGIATNIRKAGCTVGFLNHNGNQSTDDLISAGAIAYDSIAALTDACDTLVLCVTGSPQVEAILNEPGGVLSTIKPETVVIDCSTAIPASTIRIAQKLEACGAQFLDAPMTRTPKEAAEGKLNLVVGGDKSLFDAQLALLQTFAENITYAGGHGAGHTLKLVHNFVSLGFSSVLAEAAAAAAKAGIDAETLRDVLANGGGDSVVLERMTPYMLNEDVSAFSFSLSNSAKDMGYYTQMCEDLNAAASVAGSVEGVYSKQVADGNGDLYVPLLISLLNRSGTN